MLFCLITNVAISNRSTFFFYTQATSATKQARAALDALNAQRSALKSASVAVEGRSNELAAATQELDVLRICSAWQHVSLSSTQIRIQLQQRWQMRP